jgi:hypothetical protein
MTWSDAEAYAQSLGGHLATINDAAEQDWISQTFASQFSSIWIGLTDEASEGTWVWLSGQPVSYTNWASGAPGSYDYAYMSSNGQWYDGASGWNLWGLIELEGSGLSEGGPGSWSQYLLDVDVADFVAPTVVDVSPLPVSGGSTDRIVDKLQVQLSEDLDADTVNALNQMVWSYDGHFYLITDSSMTWSDAEAYAQSLGGHLVTINDASEQDWIYQTFTSLSSSIWIGLTDEASEGTWVWSSSEAVSYTNWASGEPNGGTSYNYARISSNGQWYDVYNTSAYRGLIELTGSDTDGDMVPDVLDPYPADPFNNFDLREAGADGVFDTSDDVIYRLTLDPQYSSGTTVDLFIEGGPLGDGHYRFIANSTLTDRSGNQLDGDQDGTGGDAYQHLFDVALPAGYTFEGTNNQMLITATSLTLSEDPAGGGYYVARGLGSIQPSTDVDWWSFEALAGDLVSVSLDTPDSGLYPYVYLYNAGGSLLASDYSGGPGTDAFISRYEIASTGTYYVMVSRRSGAEDSYALRVDLARGIDVVSDLN